MYPVSAPNPASDKLAIAIKGKCKKLTAITAANINPITPPINIDLKFTSLKFFSLVINKQLKNTPAVPPTTAPGITACLLMP